jgi:cytoskeletal protein RodZ
MVKKSVTLRFPQHFRRVQGWLPWLVLSLVVAGLLLPGTTAASILVFQSSPSQPPTNTPVPPPTNTPVPPPTNTPVPPPTNTVAPPPTEVATDAAAEQEVASPTPVEAATPTMEGPPPTEEMETLSTEEAVPTEAATEVATATPAPSATPVEAQESGGSSQSIVNWAKFWDTMAVTVAYPWLCCGILLLLLVPVGLIYLEIKGRRRPRTTPEEMPTRGMPPSKRPSRRDD